MICLCTNVTEQTKTGALQCAGTLVTRMVDTIKAIFINIGQKLPRKFVNAWQQKLVYSGNETDAGLWLATRMLLVPLFAMIVALIMSAFDVAGDLAAAFVFVTIISLTFFYMHLKLYFAVLERTDKLEKALPDYLMLMVSNLHAGMTPFDAFVKAARPEFGPLYREVLHAAESVGGKHSIDDAFMELGQRFNSEMFRKTIELFLRAMRSGGSIAKLLASNAEEIRRIQELRAELISSTRQQAILLAFIVAVLMPFLLAIGYNFLVIFISTQGQLSAIGAGGEKLPASVFSAAQITIKPEEMFIISIITLTLTNMLVCMFMGVLQYGRGLYGLKYLHYILTISIIAFLVTKNMLAGLLVSN